MGTRTKRVLFTLLLMLLFSSATVLASSDDRDFKPGVFKQGNDYYYNDPSTGSIRTEAGFVTSGGRLYYIRKGGRILTGKTLKLGSKYYHTTTWGPVFRGIHKWGNAYYYSDIKTGQVKLSSGFIKYNGRLYYAQKGGTIATGKTFTVGKKQYRAYANGKICVGAYRWGRKCYFSDPKTGEWIKKEQFIWWKGNRYYIQPDFTLAANKAFIIKHRLPFYADNYCRVTKISTDNPTGNKALAVAQKQVGTMTGRVYWRWFYGTRFIDTDRTPWCGAFVGWCYKKAGMFYKISAAGNIGYVPRYTSFANRRGKWINPAKAKGGDIIVFGRDRHVGIVESVHRGNIITIEGNSGPTAAYGSRKPGAVTRKAYKLSDPDIKGVIRP